MNIIKIFKDLILISSGKKISIEYENENNELNIVRSVDFHNKLFAYYIIPPTKELIYLRDTVTFTLPNKKGKNKDVKVYRPDFFFSIKDDIFKYINLQKDHISDSFRLINLREVDSVNDIYFIFQNTFISYLISYYIGVI